MYHIEVLPDSRAVVDERIRRMRVAADGAVDSGIMAEIIKQSRTPGQNSSIVCLDSDPRHVYWLNSRGNMAVKDTETGFIRGICYVGGCGRDVGPNKITCSVHSTGIMVGRDDERVAALVRRSQQEPNVPHPPDNNPNRNQEENLDPSIVGFEKIMQRLGRVAL